MVRECVGCPQPDLAVGADDLSAKHGTPAEALALAVEVVLAQGDKLEDVEESLESLLHDRESALGGGVARGASVLAHLPRLP